LPRLRVQFIGLILPALLVVASASQNGASGFAAPQSQTAVVSSVKVVHDGDSPALEIVCSRPVAPEIQTIDAPPRVVIDLPDTRPGTQPKRVEVLRENILTIRTEQRQNNPPITRIVINFLVPYGYKWDSAGNRLMVRFKPPEEPFTAGQQSPAQVPRVASLSAAAAVVPVTSGIGQVVLAGRRFAAGTSLTAGDETAVLQLSRGGQVQVCPGTTLSVTPSKSAQDLMMGLSTGAMETHYSLGAYADTVLTPDFRILLAGPGEFDYAISTDSKGNTCVRGLRGNTSSAIVSELIGNRFYQVKPNEQAVFHSGRIDKIDTDVPLECGCPPPVPVMRTENSPQVTPDSGSPNVTLAQSEAARQEQSGSSSAASSEPHHTLSAPPETLRAQANDLHVQVEAPLVFQAKQRSGVPPAQVDNALLLPIIEPARAVALQAQALPPIPAAQQKADEHRGLMHRIKGFFTAIFR
jgi:AMIN domain